LFTAFKDLLKEMWVEGVMETLLLPIQKLNSNTIMV
jgi:hypothetical protein